MEIGDLGLGFWDLHLRLKDAWAFENRLADGVGRQAAVLEHVVEGKEDGDGLGWLPCPNGESAIRAGKPRASFIVFAIASMPVIVEEFGIMTFLSSMKWALMRSAWLPSQSSRRRRSRLGAGPGHRPPGHRAPATAGSQLKLEIRRPGILTNCG